LATSLSVLKIGGSVITNKQREFAASRKTISRLTKEIHEGASGQLIVVHGGGSYGHHMAKRYELSEGYRNHSQIPGFVRTRQSMMELNKIVLDSAIRNGLPCISLQPSSFVRMKNGRIEEMNLRIVRDLLDLQMIPLLFGDVALDEELGFCILSGDQLASRLASELAATQVILAVDVDGVFDSDPKLYPKARLIGRMTAADAKALIQKRKQSAPSSDVTGQMMGKLKEMLPAVERGIQVIVLNGCVPRRVSEALKGRLTVGTVIKP